VGRKGWLYQAISATAKILAVVCILLAMGFVVGRYTMIANVAHYDGDHP
jgi:hypothetical protein